MTSPVVRLAASTDVDAVRGFGVAHVPPHYAPLIGDHAALEQVERWWTATVLAAAIERGLVVVAERGGVVVGVGQRGPVGPDQAVYKLYVHPDERGQGLGVALLRGLIERMPATTMRVQVEHFAANTRAGAFYEREGFGVDRVEPHPGGDPRLDVVWRSRAFLR